jgi:hypothetical protein
VSDLLSPSAEMPEMDVDDTRVCVGGRSRNRLRGLDIFCRCGIETADCLRAWPIGRIGRLTPVLGGVLLPFWPV